MNTNRLFQSMKARANQILKSSNPKAGPSGFAAEPLPRQPRKRARTPPGQSGVPTIPRSAARARHREQQEIGQGGLPDQMLTEYQLSVMVNRLNSMPAPASFRNTTILPPTDNTLAQNQQFLRDYLALGLDLPPASAPDSTETTGSIEAMRHSLSSPISNAPDPPRNSPYDSRNRVRSAERISNQILTASREADRQHMHSAALAARDVDEHFGLDTDANYIRMTVIRDMQRPSKTQEGSFLLRDTPTSDFEEQVPQSSLRMRLQFDDSEPASFLHSRNRLRDMSNRARTIGTRNSDPNASVLPEVTDASSLTTKVVYDTMLQSIPKSRRNLSKNRVRENEGSADSMLRRTSAQSYQPGLAESPPESFPLESLHFEPEVQDMPSYSEQLAAEQLVHRLYVETPVQAPLDILGMEAEISLGSEAMAEASNMNIDEALYRGRMVSRSEAEADQAQLHNSRSADEARTDIDSESQVQDDESIANEQQHVRGAGARRLIPRRRRHRPVQSPLRHLGQAAGAALPAEPGADDQQAPVRPA
jgi:hypothetical protein